MSGAGTHSVTESIVHIIRAIVLWTAANYFFDRLLDYPRFRNQDQQAIADVPRLEQTGPPIELASEDTRSAECANCGLLQRLKRINSLADITVVKAEEHYVRVYSERDQELIAYRFGKAIKDLNSEDGFQVHR
ncbi:MAG: hypothetical protein AAF709_07725, partial [Pseudomonadota bacterium]